MSKVTFLNPKTCGIYKDGGPRYKTDPATGRRTTQIDNELIEQVDAYLEGRADAGATEVTLDTVFGRGVLVPTYYDDRYNDAFRKAVADMDVESVTLGELIDGGTIAVRGGHGSPGNDQRSGHIPYVKVSDIRGLRVNINPTNLVTDSVARRFWRGPSSGLEEWDVITPNRASSNIGEFAILLPGEEQVVVTKEVFVFRVLKDDLLDPFYLLWALSLQCVREQWRRVALMQTNREDCGSRYREVMIPMPPSKEWAREQSAAFRDYFKSVADAKARFVEQTQTDGLAYVANVKAAVAMADGDVEPEDEPETKPKRKTRKK
jgi:type I restriction enzyme M protein